MEVLYSVILVHERSLIWSAAVRSVYSALPPIGLLTVYEMYGRSESEHMLGPGEMLPGLIPSPLSGLASLSGTDLPLCRLARPPLDEACPCCELCSEPIVLLQLEETRAH